MDCWSKKMLKVAILLGAALSILVFPGLPDISVTPAMAQAIQIQLPSLWPELNISFVFDVDARHRDLIINNPSQLNGIEPRAIIALEEGRDASKDGDYSKAIHKFSDALKIEKSLPEAYIARGSAYFKRNQYDQALKDYNQALLIDPQNCYANLGKAYVYMDQDNKGAALSNYAAVLESNENFYEAYYGEGEVYRDLGNIDKAIVRLSKAVELNPQYAAAFLLRSEIYSQQGQDALAAEDANEALRIATRLNSSDIALAHYTRSLSNHRLGRLQDVEKGYSYAIKLEPTLKVAYLSRANFYEEIKKYDKAINDYSQYMAIEPQDIDVIFARGEAYIQTQDFESAIFDFDTVLKAQPNNVPAYLCHATANFLLRNYTATLEDLDIAISQADDEAEDKAVLRFITWAYTTVQSKIDQNIPHSQEDLITAGFQQQLITARQQLSIAA